MNFAARVLQPEDRPGLERLLTRIDVFTEDDRAIALELIDIAITNPAQEDYRFCLTWDETGDIIGYACFGPTPLTDRTYDLYWIGVDRAFAGQGVGTRLMQKVEEVIVHENGRMIIIETSSGSEYDLTRKFYLKSGYQLAETIQDFFKDGEDRVTYIKRLNPSSVTHYG